MSVHCINKEIVWLQRALEAEAALESGRAAAVISKADFNLKKSQHIQVPPGGLISKSPNQPKASWKWRWGCEHTLRQRGGWMCGLCVLVVEPRVQQGDTFLVSDTPLFSRVGLIPQR